uniref:Uncharacterized protein n=1 Tax=Plectus sambesii TaxID=2011161 RepID=A0A914XIQ5_9BILA
MLFVPAITAAAASEQDKLREDEERTKKQLEEINATPVAYERVLQKMDEKTLEVISHDEHKLKQEAHKIAHLQRKINKEELKFAEMQRELCEKEQKEAELQERMLRKAKEDAKRDGRHRDESPVEKLEEVLHNVKDFAKDVLGDVAGFATHIFADDKGPKEHRAAPGKRERKWRKATERIDHLQKKLAKKRQATIVEDDKLLIKEARKIELLQMQLVEEERNFVQTEAELTEELQYEARIREQERKLKEFEQSTSAIDEGSDQPHLHHHHIHRHSLDNHGATQF